MGVPVSPVSLVELHVQVGAMSITASTPHHGAAAAIYTHSQHQRHGQVTRAELSSALVLAGDSAGKHGDGGDPKPP